jgi:uncharacterized membrane protein YsdA (DUF1294 family)
MMEGGMTRGSSALGDRRTSRANPFRRYAIAGFGLSAVLAVVLGIVTPLDPLLAWLVAISIVTFLVWGYDKAIAGSGRLRVPERVLLALTFAGGTLGALLGMRVFRHKTIKASFRRRFWVAVVLQVALVAAWFLLR